MTDSATQWRQLSEIVGAVLKTIEPAPIRVEAEKAATLALRPTGPVR